MHIIHLLIYTLAVLVPLHASARSATASPSAEPQPRYLYRNGLAQGELYLPMNDANATLRFAAQELQDHLQAITGGLMPMAYREIRPTDGGILLAVRPRAQWNDDASAQDFTITQDPQHCRVEIVGNTSLAVLYGVYQYLSDLGVRWYAPGEVGTDVSRMSDILIRPGQKSYRPSFEGRSMALSSTMKNYFSGANGEKDFYDYQLYLMRNRTQLDRFAAWQGAFGFNIEGTGSGHAIKPMTGLTRERVRTGLMEQSPERFALVTGADGVQKRRYNDGQVCFTNRTNINTAIENVVAFFDNLEATRSRRGTDLDQQYTAPLGLSDTTGMCECDACRQVAGSGPNSDDRLAWSFWNQVARGLNERRPGRMIAVFAPYMELTHPPADVVIEPNVLVATPLVFSWEHSMKEEGTYPFPAAFINNVSRLREAGGTLASYTYLSYPWGPSTLLVLDQAKGFSEMGYKYYHMEAMQRSEYTWPIIWSLAQFTWDSSRDPRDYLQEYCTQYYGESAGAIVRNLLEDMTDHALSMERINFGGPADTCYMLPDALITEYRQNLRRVLVDAQGKQKIRLQRFSDAIEAQFQLAEVYRAHVTALNTRKDADVSHFREMAQKLVTFWSMHNLVEISSRYRTPAVAARQLLDTEFGNLKPVARKELQGKTSTDHVWMTNLFAGSSVPEKVDDLFPLPEVWDLHLDATRSGSQEVFSGPSYNDAHAWQPVSTWNTISAQGYGPQLGGYFWYRIVFTPPPFPEGKKVILRIGSLDDTGDVFLNGKLVGTQPDPQSWDKSFAMDVTIYLKPGQSNVLVVHGYDSGGAEGIWRPSALYTE